MIIKNLQEFYRLLIPNEPLIAIDYGSKKIGVALSDQALAIAMPLNTITELNQRVIITSLLNIIEKYQVCGIVIGLPIDMSGGVTKQTNIVMKFADKLKQSVSLPIYLQDERLTTKSANNFLKSFGIKRKDRNNNDDAVAASMILEIVLNAIKRFNL
ncbi:Holliday junction resolvase RuvX [Rickettsia typhi]|uniref:Putative pre-16S rRNA nuclease n=2 Tax=Rickettsia typhi TaxID=785 RepID=YQGF_RICTY|nr:Holliday junction resolvase RuvX [Rickettsia typhi]Q68X41.1 RecName: Full=Putative pre-16S rRNA nuclease [Rickettsia typhi str. Wilmington]AAU03801.1 possible Holliday junction resolvase [Rickettsia typhi str. Wilmington]AFE54178.1 Holliday junction resolvase-like protein [Rickettsia typhi str. TH1527]AFE55018.1 Holliday junction resolvase-like protein [Rickettsia typhi str. B9991CWPP]